MREQVERLINVSQADFAEAVLAQSYETAVVVDFWAGWCGPCRMLGPLLERLALEKDSDFILAKVDVDANPGLAAEYGVQGIPAVKGFRDGQVVADFVGAQPEPMVREFLKRVSPSEADRLLSVANSYLLQDRWEDAESAYRDVLDGAPQNAAAWMGLSRALLAQGAGCEAQRLLQRISEPKFLTLTEQLMPLANFLCSAPEASPENGAAKTHDAQYWRAAGRFRQGELELALGELIDLLRQDKRYREGEAKAAVLGIFALLGENHELTRRYRPQLAMALF